MLIRTHKEPGEFFMMHKQPIESAELSWKAKGILAYLMSKPSDWTIIISDLVKHSADGESALRNGLAEMERAGYLVKRREHDDNGLFTWVCVVYETPVPPEERSNPDDRKLTQPRKKSSQPPFAGNPQMDNPEMEKSYPTNNDGTKNNGTNNENTHPVSDELKSELDRFFGEKDAPPADIPERVNLADPAARDEYAARLVAQRSAKKTAEPWTLYTPYRYTPRNGITAESLQHVDYLINTITGLECGSDAARKFWQNGLAQVYQEGKGNWQHIEAGIKTAWTRETRYRPSNPAGFADEVRKARAAIQQPTTPTSGGWFIPGGSSVQEGEY